MAEDLTYRDYVKSDFMDDYVEYQQRYADEPRESDKVIIDYVRTAIELGDKSPVLLDIGCSTGNLLRHLKPALPQAKLIGGELAEAALDFCRRDSALSGIAFEYLDALDLPKDSYDVVISNAVLCLFNQEDYDNAIRSIAASLKPGGSLISFDWLHPFNQELEIREVSRSHPEGMFLYFRSFDSVERSLRTAGFEEISFRPFEIPIDLERGDIYGNNETGFEDLNSYTVETTEQTRMIFRGTLYTPWCHLFARKPG